jgi:hypothetical protein
MEKLSCDASRQRKASEAAQDIGGRSGAAASFAKYALRDATQH